MFTNLFGKSNTPNDATKVNWIPLTTITQLNDIKSLSANETVGVFKHSTRCGISSMVIKRFENSFDQELKSLKMYYLDLLNYREISNKIAEEFQVQHQSPQLLIIKNKEAVLHASHYDILDVDLKKI